MGINDEEYISFDQFAENYDFTRDISDVLLKMFMKSFLELFDPVEKIKNILEIGCGTGRVSKIFASQNYSVTGVDISSKMLDIALQKAQRENWNFRGILSDARKLPFKKNEFDVAYTVHVLHLVKDWKKVIQEALRCSHNRFINVFMERRIFSTDIMKNYWKFINEHDTNHDFRSDNKLGAKDTQEVIDYMNSINYSYHDKEFEINTQIDKQMLIKIVKLKAFSSQRFIPDAIHSHAMLYLKENDFFLPDTDKVVVAERGAIFSFFKDG